MKRWLVCFGLLVALALPAFVLNNDGTTSYLRWSLFTPTGGVSTNVINLNTHAVRYFLASDAYSATNTAAELNALRASFAQWMAVSNSNIKFEEGGLVSGPVDVNSEDNTNIVYWTKNSTLVDGGMYDIGSSLGVTFTTWEVPSLRLTHADIVFNGVNYAWFTDIADPTTTRQFVDGVALHEIGHMIGLDHSPLAGATMFWRGGGGVNPQNGLHADDLAGTRFLYPTNGGTYGAIKGTILKVGSPVLGAVITAYDATTNTIAGTLSRADGTYAFYKLPPGNYRLRVTPLDPYVFQRICAGNDINFAEYGGADTSFQTSVLVSAAVVGNATNTVDFAVSAGAPAVRITRVVSPTTTLSSFFYGGTPIQLRAGQSNYYTGLAWDAGPTNGTRMYVTGDGITLGPPIHFDNGALRFVFSLVMVASNATPGLRDLVFSNATSFAYAPGLLTILPTVTDDNFDGLDDIFQRAYFAPFTAAEASPTSNPDNDPFNNLAEYISGTVPTNAASFLKISSLSNSPSGTTVRWLGSIGKKYQVSARTNLTTAGWQNVGNVVTTTNLFDNTPPAATRYYRVEALP